MRFVPTPRGGGGIKTWSHAHRVRRLGRVAGLMALAMAGLVLAGGPEATAQTAVPERAPIERTPLPAPGLSQEPAPPAPGVSAQEAPGTGGLPSPADAPDADSPAPLPAPGLPFPDVSAPPAEERPSAPPTWPIAVLQGLGKVTGRISTFEAKIDESVRFGTLNIVVRYCYKKPPEEPPESTAFMEIEEVKRGEPPVLRFRGWMFASSPALSALEHPVYDVWVVGCRKHSRSSSLSPAGKLAERSSASASRWR